MADKLADARTTRSSSWLFRADDDAPDDDAPARRPTTAARSYSWLFRSDDDETTAAGPQDTAATNDARAEEGGGAIEPAWLQRAYSSAVLHHDHQAMPAVSKEEDESTVVRQPPSLASLPETADTHGESDEEPHWLSAAASVLHRAGGKARRSVMAMVQIVRTGDRERAEGVAGNVIPEQENSVSGIRPDAAVAHDADWASQWLDLQACFLCARAKPAR